MKQLGFHTLAVGMQSRRKATRWVRRKVGVHVPWQSCPGAVKAYVHRPLVRAAFFLKAKKVDFCAQQQENGCMKFIIVYFLAVKMSGQRTHRIMCINPKSVRLRERTQTRKRAHV